VPGESGTATIAGHVTNLVGPEIFAHIEDLHPGDLIIIRIKYTSIYLRFIVDEVKVYSDAQSSDPAVLAQIYGIGPVAGTRPQPSPDGLSHLTLITCSGYVRNNKFVNHAVVYATLSQ
jgi:sortase (surface protein transpeptidase)